MNKFPDNFKCVLWNNDYYFTHFYDGFVSRPKELKLTYIRASKQDIENNNAYSHSASFEDFPNNDIKWVVKAHFRGNLSYKNHDFTKDTFEEIAFKDLPVKVKKIFRCFEKHNGFKISEAVSFNINNTF